MCGIAGLVELAGQPDPELVESMLGTLVHRGPDDQGCAPLGSAVLGMRRLSILDTSPRGHQPMRSRDGQLWLVYNGEIYNFLELAAELAALGHRFETETDTEVVLAAYAEWGIDCVTRFNGIWAFALWDAGRQRLMLSRDRFGVKPLFVARRNGSVAFASEIKALRVLPWVSSDLEPAAVHDFLRDGMVDHTKHTFFKDIDRLPAAHSMVIDRQGEALVSLLAATGSRRRRVGTARPVRCATRHERARSAHRCGRPAASRRCPHRFLSLWRSRQQRNRQHRGRPAARGAASAVVDSARTRCQSTAGILRRVPRGGDRRAALRRCGRGGNRCHAGDDDTGRPRHSEHAAGGPAGTGRTLRVHAASLRSIS